MQKLFQIEEIWTRYAAGAKGEAAELLDKLFTEAPEHKQVLMTKAVFAAIEGDINKCRLLQRRAIAEQVVDEANTMADCDRESEAKNLAMVALRFDENNRRASNLLASRNKTTIVFDSAVAALGYPSPIRCDTANGVFFLPADAPDDLVAMRLKAGVLYQPEIIDVCRTFFRPNTTIVDLGANLGAMSLPFSRIAGEGGKVVSIEASPYIHRLLELTLEANNIHNVELLNLAVFDKSGVELVYPRPNLETHATYGSYGIDPSAPEGFKIKGVALDDLEFTTPVSFIKVDVQGADLSAMKGAMNLIARDRPAIVFEYEDDLSLKFGYSSNDYRSFIEEIGYKIERQFYSDYLILPH